MTPSPDGNAVAAQRFRLVHHGVGGADDGLDGVAVFRKCCEAEAAGERKVEALTGEEAGFAQTVPELSGGFDRGFLT